MGETEITEEGPDPLKCGTRPRARSSANRSPATREALLPGEASTGAEKVPKVRAAPAGTRLAGCALAFCVLTEREILNSTLGAGGRKLPPFMGEINARW